MRFVLLSFAVLLAGPVLAQVGPPPGAYRTAAAYHRQKPQPAGTDASYPDKRGQLVVTVPHGPRTEKVRIAPDSAWGYVNNKSRTFRIFRGEEFRLVQADTLCVYSSISSQGMYASRTGTSTGQLNYFFSRGLTGLIFPLTLQYLRQAYETSNPTFVAALGKLRFDQGLTDYDRGTGLYRVTTVYRDAAASGH